MKVFKDNHPIQYLQEYLEDETHLPNLGNSYFDVLG